MYTYSHYISFLLLFNNKNRTKKGKNLYKYQNIEYFGYYKTFKKFINETTTFLNLTNSEKSIQDIFEEMEGFYKNKTLSKLIIF